MRKSFAIILVIASCLLVIAGLPAIAEHYTSGSYDLWTVPNSGSSLDLTNGTYHLQDVKGTPFGFYLGAGYDIWTGIGVLVGSAEGGGGEEEEAATFIDTGLIRKTWIERNGANAILHWDFDPAHPEIAGVDIWEKPSSYSASADAWPVAAFVTGIPKATKTQTLTGIINNGTSYYYRVVPQGTAKAQIMNPANNSITVAKIEFNLVKKYNLMSLPVYPTSANDPAEPNDPNINRAVGDQLLQGSQIYRFNPSTQLPQMCMKTDTWSGSFDSFNILEGYWCFVDPNHIYSTTDGNPYVSIVGRVLNFSPSLEAVEKYNLLAQPFPLTRATPPAAGFTLGANGDQIYYFNEATQLPGNPAAFDGTNWTGIFPLEPKRGYWYFRNVGNSTFKWEPTLN